MFAHQSKVAAASLVCAIDTVLDVCVLSIYLARAKFLWKKIFIIAIKEVIFSCDSQKNRGFLFWAPQLFFLVHDSRTPTIFLKKLNISRSVVGPLWTMSYPEVGMAYLSRALSGHSSVCVVFSHSRTAIRRAHPYVVMVTLYCCSATVIKVIKENLPTGMKLANSAGDLVFKCAMGKCTLRTCEVFLHLEFRNESVNLGALSAQDRSHFPVYAA